MPHLQSFTMPDSDDSGLPNKYVKSVTGGAL